MKILFVMDKRVNAGSVHAVANYVAAGEECGHIIALYGRPDPRFPGIRFSTEPGDFDGVLFIIESGLSWMSGLRMPRLLSEIPRNRRAILDADGMYGERIVVDSYDRNHPTEGQHRAWLACYDLLSDTVFQPSLQPRDRRVIGLPFYGYSPSQRVARGCCAEKDFDVVHVAHNWWRWRALSTGLLPALERIRGSVDGVCFVGAWWDGPPSGIGPELEAAFQVDVRRLRQLRIQVKPPVVFTEVVQTMSRGRINILTQRPLLLHLRLLTSKYFEVFCADTIPLLLIDPAQAECVYGPAARELALTGTPEEKLLDVLRRPGKYREIVEEVRRHLAVHHCYQRRIEELVAALSSATREVASACT